jgi:ribosomal protein S18 acetylase RimI-like enzyme
MSKKLKNGLVLNIIDLPIPILKHPKWLEIKYPPKTKEKKIVDLLKDSFLEIKKIARQNKTNQIKIATNPSWNRLTEINFTKTVYYMVVNPNFLCSLKTKAVQINKVKHPEEIKDLIKSQFEYHCQYKPAYFTCDIESRVQEYITIVKKIIIKKQGFILEIIINKNSVGFIHGDIYKNEGCIDELFVKEKFRNKGLGKALVKRAGKIFKNKSLKKVGLFVGSDQESLGFYKYLGFKKELTNWIINLN